MSKQEAVTAVIWLDVFCCGPGNIHALRLAMRTEGRPNGRVLASCMRTDALITAWRPCGKPMHWYQLAIPDWKLMHWYQLVVPVWDLMLWYQLTIPVLELMHWYQRDVPIWACHPSLKTDALVSARRPCLPTDALVSACNPCVRTDALTVNSLSSMCEDRCPDISLPSHGENRCGADIGLPSQGENKCADISLPSQGKNWCTGISCCPFMTSNDSIYCNSRQCGQARLQDNCIRLHARVFFLLLYSGLEQGSIMIMCAVSVVLASEFPAKRLRLFYGHLYTTAPAKKTLTI